MGERVVRSRVKPCQTFHLRWRLNLKSEKSFRSPEYKYWKTFKSHEIPKLIYPVTSVDFFPCDSNDFAATHSASLTLFSSETFEKKSTISSFSDVAYSASFRSDGKLIAAGCRSGIVQVFDVQSRSPLRHFRGHTKPVRLVRYPRVDKLHLFSGGDDALVKYWDVVSETQISEWVGHKDYVVCGDGSPVTDDVFTTGSYDHTVRMWDVRNSDNGGAVMEINHEKPVEDVLFLPSASLIATAGGNVVKIWDVVGGGKLVHTVECHTKTVTAMCVGKIQKEIDGGESSLFRLLSVGLDGYMKVFDFAKMKVTHSMRYPFPLLSIAVSSDHSTRAVGTSNGIIFAAKRKTAPATAEVDVDAVSKRRISRMRYFANEAKPTSAENDFRVLKRKTVRLYEHERLLKKFRHKDALVSALRTRNKNDVVAVVEELIARRKMKKCVVNLNAEELVLFVSFLSRCVSLPRFSRLLTALVAAVVELRAEDIRSSEELRAQLVNVRRTSMEELEIQEGVLELRGIVSALLRTAGRRR